MIGRNRLLVVAVLTVAWEAHGELAHPPSRIFRKTRPVHERASIINVPQWNLHDPASRAEVVRRLTSSATMARAGAEKKFRDFGVDDSIPVMGRQGGMPLVRSTLNWTSAVSIAVDPVRQQEPYNLSGADCVVGIWDAGLIRASHDELIPRVTIMEAGSLDDHATHVAGTLAGAGSNTSAKGMAPDVSIQSHEWNNDLAEVTALAMAYAGEPDRIQISNHSYDYSTGWSYNGGTWYWYGVSGQRESYAFGIYDNTARDLDILACNAPYYLQIRAAGNDRGDEGPAGGSMFLYALPDGSFSFGFLDPSTGPHPDNWDRGGYDTIPHEQNAKNILVVGAVGDAVDDDGQRCATNATMTSFSSWGPTDDGRIKPDVVANGEGVFTAAAAADNSYVSYSGTSIAAPAASGAAVLVLELFGRLFPNEWMRASTLKALLIHTADDLHPVGPDYRTGWGLINAKAACDHLLAHRADRTANDVREWQFSFADEVHSYFYVWDGVSPIKATLCWTDPPGPEHTDYQSIDDPTLRLVHDLDLKVTAPGGTTNMPFVLDPSNPESPAGSGDNVRDNVEQVVIAGPESGLYRIDVEMKGDLVDDEQHYSLIVSGLRRGDEIASASVGAGHDVSWNSWSGAVYRIQSRPLTDEVWNVVGTVTAAAAQVSFTDTNRTASGKWYRFELR